jgi:hypothetical protein
VRLLARIWFIPPGTGGAFMGIQRSRPDYTVWVDRRMFGDSRFVIEAALEYRAGLSVEQRERLTPMAQLELLLAIEGEEERGRLLGGRPCACTCSETSVCIGSSGGGPRRREGRSRRMGGRSAGGKSRAVARPLQEA